MAGLTVTLRQGQHVQIGDDIVVAVVRFTVQESRSGERYPQVVINIVAPASSRIRRGS